MSNYIANINGYSIGGNNFDCEWVINPVLLASDVTWGATSVTSYNLSSYIPSNGYDYLVAFGGWSRTPSGSGNTIIRVMSGSRTYANAYAYGCRMMIAEYHSTSSYICSGNLIIPIFSNSRYVTVANTASNATGSSGFYIIGYRRLGTNT